MIIFFSLFFFSSIMSVGTVPTSIGDLLLLQFFDISSTNITGTLPASICDAEFLQYLTIPEAMCYPSCTSQAIASSNTRCQDGQDGQDASLCEMSKSINVLDRLLERALAIFESVYGPNHESTLITKRSLRGLGNSRPRKPIGTSLSNLRHTFICTCPFVIIFGKEERKQLNKRRFFRLLS